MFAFEPDRTQFDLSWRMLGIPVRVHPMFWLMSAILGWSSIELGITYLLIWIACVFVSVLVHELGHVFAGRVFGTDGHIVLYGFGGLAFGSSDLRERWQRNVVYFAGPLAGFLFLVAILAVVLGANPPNDVSEITDRLPFRWFTSKLVQMADAGWSPYVIFAVWELCFINLFWGLLNLLPIWPLDGGRISRETAEWISLRQGARYALIFSGILAAVIALNSLIAMNRPPLIPWIPTGGFFMAFFFGMLAISSFQIAQAESRKGAWEGREYEDVDRSDDWKRDREDWR